VTPSDCASLIGENRAADVVTVPVAFAESVNVVLTIALIFVPNGTFGWLTYMPMKRPVADATVAVGLPLVVLIVVETCTTFGGLPLTSAEKPFQA